MDVAHKRLVKKDAALIQVLDPPFDISNLEPGYIKGYLPGVRENGGQYTHAAVWMIMAYARMGDKRRTWELLQMINPVNHSKSKQETELYKVEPYVLAADVYSIAPHTGRGGWTWYTGSAGWLYQLIVESFLGICKEGDKLRFEPCIPEEWPSYKVHYRYLNTIYHIAVKQKKGTGNGELNVDGIKIADRVVVLLDDGKEHTVELTIFTEKALHPEIRPLVGIL